ncbi:lITAF domain-containing protein [Manis pentadactyla]|uniref:lITAF domain-containing protein n=1 Tax=Manis pentadactyla TaxID=143292 RepID=UPI00255C7DC4|nr:lITAF domain-containing protein [Manis pentadactyla]
MPVVRSATPAQSPCPSGGKHIVTATTPIPGARTWLLCTGLLVFRCFLGCCFIPFCVDSLTDVKHTCPVCQQEHLRYQRL